MKVIILLMVAELSEQRGFVELFCWFLSKLLQKVMLFKKKKKTQPISINNSYLSLS